MRRRISRCVLLALLTAFSAAPAAAGTIVGSFFFTFDDACFGDPDCQPFEYFTLTNDVDPGDPLLGGLTFSAVIQINGSDYEEQFFPSAPIGSFEFASTLGLPATPPLADAARASLVFTGGNVALFGGTLRLSNLLFDDVSSPSFSANVEFTANAVTEAPSWLVVVIGLGALAVGRVFLI